MHAWQQFARRLVAVALLVLLVPVSSPMAQQPLATPSVVQSTCSEYYGLTSRIVMCVRESVGKAMTAYFKDFYPYVKGAVAGFLTLSVVVIGVMASFGMLEKIGRDTFIFTMKLTMVSFFSATAPQIYYTIIPIMDAAAGAVVEFTPTSGPLTDEATIDQSTCYKRMQENIQNSGSQTYSAPWLTVDCMLDSVFGIKIDSLVQSANKNTPTKGAADGWYNENLQGNGLSRGMTAFFFSSLQTSILGLLFGAIGFFFLYGIVWLILKALFVYLGAFIALAFMCLFAPFFIPLVMFRVTKPYFDKWVKLTLSFMLQPVIILAFVTFMLAAVDLVLFTGQYSVMYRIAGEESRRADFNLNSYLEAKEIITKESAAPIQLRTGRSSEGIEKTAAGLIGEAVIRDCSEAVTKMDPKAEQICSESYPVKFWKDSINWKNMAAARNPAVTIESPSTTPEQQISREVIAALLFAAVVVYVLNGLMHVVPSIVNDLLGDAYSSPSLSSGFSRRGGGGLGDAVSRISSQIQGRK